jgi:hypothetical protein
MCGVLRIVEIGGRIKDGGNGGGDPGLLEKP